VSATGAASPITVDGLVNGVSWVFTVTATNAAGTSQPSDESNPVVPPELPEFAADMIAPACSDTAPVDEIVLDDSTDCGTHWWFMNYRFTFVFDNPDVVDTVAFSALPDPDIGWLAWYDCDTETDETCGGDSFVDWHNVETVSDNPDAVYDADTLFSFGHSPWWDDPGVTDFTVTAKNDAGSSEPQTVSVTVPPPCDCEDSD